MTQLTTDTARRYAMTSDEHINHLPVLTSVDIFAGSAVGNSGGFARQLVANDKFMGFAQERADNNPGASGAINVKLAQKGRITLTLAALADTDLGADVFASDGNTFTLSGSGNSPIGKVSQVIDTTAKNAWVTFAAEMTQDAIDVLTNAI